MEVTEEERLTGLPLYLDSAVLNTALGQARRSSPVVRGLRFLEVSNRTDSGLSDPGNLTTSMACTDVLRYRCSSLLVEIG